MRDKIKRIARIIVNNKYFELSIFTLILISVVFIFWEIVFLPSETDNWVTRTNEFIILIFVVELTLRYFASTNFKTFISTYWIDILAIIPFLRPFRFIRILRVLRVVRMASLAIFMRRHLRAFTYLFKKKILEYAIIFAVIAFVVVFSTAIYIHFEFAKTEGVPFQHLEKAFWITIYSLFAGEFSNEFPKTLGGKITVLIVTFSGMGLFAILTGTVSAIMIERLREGAILGKLNFKDMDNHIIICGWNDSVGKILAEFQSDPDYKGRSFVIISEIEELPDLSIFNVDMTGVYHVKRDFINAETLKFANIEDASIAIILADMNNGRSDYDADARTVLAALTIEKLNPDIYSCAELIHPENESHLKMSKVESIVLSSNISAYMMTQAAMKSSVVPFYTELLRPSQGNQVFEVEIPEDMVGINFDEVMTIWKEEHSAILVGVQKPGGKVIINPNSYIFEEEDKALVIACKKPKFSRR